MYYFIGNINGLIFFILIIGLIAVILNSNWKKPMYFLITSLLILLLQSFSSYTILTGNFIKFPQLLKLIDPFLFLIGPLIYFFTLSLFNSKKKFTKVDLLHFIPFLLNLIELLPYYLSSVELKIQIVQEFLSSDTLNSNQYKFSILSSFWHTVLNSLSLIIYLILSFKFYFGFKSKIKTVILTDYNSRFSFAKLYYLINFIGFIVLIFGVLSFHTNLYLVFVCILNSLINLIIIFALIFKYPEFIYGNIYDDNNLIQRKSLMDIALKQSENLFLLENSKYEINFLIDDEFRIKYFDKSAYDFILSTINKNLIVDIDFREVLPLTILPKFELYIKQSLKGKSNNFEQIIKNIQLETNSSYEIQIKPHHNLYGEIIAVAIGISNIDAKKKMDSLQEKYIESLDSLAWKSSHTLRAPVSNMKGIIEVLQSNYIDKTFEESNQLIGYLSSELNRLDNVIIDMVSKARKELEN